MNETGKLIAYLLVGCPYSREAEKFIKMYEIPYKKILVQQDQKEKIKEQNNMTTFPQIFYEHPGKTDLIKIGGYDDLISFFELYNELVKLPIEMHLNIINSFDVIDRKKDLLRVMNFIFEYLKNKP